MLKNQFLTESELDIIYNKTALIPDYLHLIDKLENYLVKLNDAYSNQTPLVSDQEYDNLRDILESVKPNSKVLNMVGALPERGEVNLPVWMGSLNKVKLSSKGLENFLLAEPKKYVISEKLDGVSLLLVRNHEGWRCFTRGNGVIGQDVTSTILPILNIPDSQLLKESDDIIVRGEVILAKTSAEVLSTNKNLRTIVSGIITAKKPKKEVLKLTNFIAYSLPLSNLPPSKQFYLLKKYGFTIPKTTQINNHLGQDMLEKTLISWKKSSLYDIDGIVVAKDIPELPTKNKNPKMTVAFKMMLENQTRITKVIKVEWNCSKDRSIGLCFDYYLFHLLE